MQYFLTKLSSSIILNIIAKSLSFILYFITVYFLQSSYDKNLLTIFLFICSLYSIYFFFDLGSINATSHIVYDKQKQILHENIRYSLLISLFISILLLILFLIFYLFFEKFNLISDLPISKINFLKNSFILYSSLFCLFLISSHIERILIIIDKSKMYNLTIIFCSLLMISILFFKNNDLTFYEYFLVLFLSHYISPLIHLIPLLRITGKVKLSYINFKNFLYRYMSSSFTFIGLNILYLLFFGFDILFISNFKDSESLISFTFLQRLGQLILMPGYIYLIFLWKKINVMKKNDMNIGLNNLLQKYFKFYIPILFAITLIFSSLIFMGQEIIYNFNFTFTSIISVFLRSSIELIFWGTAFIMITIGIKTKFKIFILFFAIIYFVSKFLLITQSLESFILIENTIILIMIFTTINLFNFDYDRH